jgi:hypothetical protein
VGNKEVITTCVVKDFCNLGEAMAVSISLDHSARQSTRLSSLKGAPVFGDMVQMDAGAWAKAHNLELLQRFVAYVSP